MEGRVPAVVAMLLLVMVVGVLGDQTSSTPNDYFDCFANTCPKYQCTSFPLTIKEACVAYCAGRCAIPPLNNFGGQTSSTPNDYFDCFANTCPKYQCTSFPLTIKEACVAYCAGRCAIPPLNNLVDKANHYCNLGCTSVKCFDNHLHNDEAAAGACVNACSHICTTTKPAAALA